MSHFSICPVCGQQASAGHACSKALPVITGGRGNKVVALMEIELLEKKVAAQNALLDECEKALRKTWAECYMLLELRLSVESVIAKLEKRSK